MSAAVIKQIEIGDQTFTLVAKFGTMRNAERELGMPITKIGENMGFDALSALFWAFLQPKHRMTRDASDNLVDEFGIETLGTTIAEMLTGYFGTDAGEEETPGKGKAAKAGAN